MRVGNRDLLLHGFRHGEFQSAGQIGPAQQSHRRRREELDDPLEWSRAGRGTQLDALGEFAQRMDYEVLAFAAVDRDGVPIYHTNVLMNIGEQLAVICDEAISNSDQREAVLERLIATGHRVVSLSYDQLDAFAGNMLELRSVAGERIIAMSQQALESLDDSQLATLQANGKILSVPIDNIESSAGGSVRCMLAEIHLPHRE